MEKPKAKRKGKIGHKLNFTLGDLEANKAGFIGHNQRKRLLRLCFLSQEFFWHTGFSLFFGYIAITLALSASLNIWVRFVGSGLISILAFLITYGPLWNGHMQLYIENIQRRKKVRKVFLASGQSHYTIGTSRYHVPYWQGDILNPNHDYWLYVTPNVYASGPIILSFEVAFLDNYLQKDCGT